MKKYFRLFIISALILTLVACTSENKQGTARIEKQKIALNLKKENVISWLNDNKIEAIESLDYKNNEDFYKSKVLTVIKESQKGDYVPVFDYKDSGRFFCQVVEATGFIPNDEVYEHWTAAYKNYTGMDYKKD